jgi:hypothetical protein
MTHNEKYCKLKYKYEKLIKKHFEYNLIDYSIFGQEIEQKMRKLFTMIFISKL